MIDVKKRLEDEIRTLDYELKVQLPKEIQTAREYGPEDIVDDIRGEPSGHFVVIAGYDRLRRHVLVVDPYQPNPYGAALEYWLSIDRVVAAILLGIVTHDANLLVVYPPRLLS